MEQQSKARLDEMAVRLLGIIAVRGLPRNQQIAVLSRVGFAPREVAILLGTTANSVRVSLVSIRKAEKEGRRLGLVEEEKKMKSE
jgi:hypothetical protein